MKSIARIVGVLLAAAPFVHAVALQSTHYSVSPGAADTLANGADGSIWYSGFGFVGRVAKDGSVAEFPIAQYPRGMATGPDGNAWIATDSITDGTSPIFDVLPNGSFVQKAVLTDSDGPIGLATGPDGMLWIAYDRVNIGGSYGFLKSDGTRQFFLAPNGFLSTTMTTGPDGNLWFAEDAQIGRMTSNGEFTSYGISPSPDMHAPLQPTSIVSAPDGNLWISNNFVNYAMCPTVPTEAALARMDVTGAATDYPLPDNEISNTAAVTIGSDGNVWALEWTSETCRLVRRTGAGTFTSYEIPSDCSFILAGNDGNLWVSSVMRGEIIKVTLPADLIFSDGVDAL